MHGRQLRHVNGGYRRERWGRGVEDRYDVDAITATSKATCDADHNPPGWAGRRGIPLKIHVRMVNSLHTRTCLLHDRIS